jgi:hypothetical protein
LQKVQDIFVPGNLASGTELWEPLLDDSACSLMKSIPKALQLDSASNLAKPCPFISLVGLISSSNSRILVIHLPLLPSMSGYIRMSFIEIEGTYAMIFECRI